MGLAGKEARFLRACWRGVGWGGLVDFMWLAGLAVWQRGVVVYNSSMGEVADNLRSVTRGDGASAAVGGGLSSVPSTTTSTATSFSISSASSIPSSADSSTKAAAGSDARAGFSSQTRFVLLVPASCEQPGKLMAGLRQRAVGVRVVRDAAMAMVELARFEAGVLIVHRPEAVAELESLLTAVRVYHPGVLCWRHDPATSQQRERLSSFLCDLGEHQQPRMQPCPERLRTPAMKVNGHWATGQAGAAAGHGQAHDNGHGKGGDVDGRADVNGRGDVNGHGEMLHEMKPGGCNGMNGFSEASFGQRLAQAQQGGTAAAGPGSFTPLLSPEEIELLRGPVDDGPYPLRGRATGQQ